MGWENVLSEGEDVYCPQDVAKSLAGLRENSQKNRELEETNRKVDEAIKEDQKDAGGTGGRTTAGR